MRRRSASALARAMKTGMARAARPEVDGTANAVATSTPVVRWISCRGVFAPAAIHAAARVASPVAVIPAAITKAASKSQMVSSPSEENRSASGSTPMSTSTTAAPKAIKVSPTGEKTQSQMAKAKTARVRAPWAGNACTVPASGPKAP